MCEREAIGAPSILRLMTENFTKSGLKQSFFFPCLFAQGMDAWHELAA